MKVARTELYRVIDDVAQGLKNAGGRDGKLSARNLGRASQLFDTNEQAVAEKLVTVARERKTNPHTAVTAREIDRALPTVKEQLVDAYDPDGDGLSEAEVQAMPSLSKWAVRVAADNLETRKYVESSVHEIAAALGLAPGSIDFNVDSDMAASGTIAGKPFKLLVSFSALLSVDGRRVTKPWGDGPFTAELPSGENRVREVELSGPDALRFLLDGVTPEGPAAA